MSTEPFHYINNELYVERVRTMTLAEQFGTPLYVYSRAALTAAYQAYADACSGRAASIYYAVKANSNIAILNLFARLGAGFDIVSGGELARVLAAGGCAKQVVFSGVGKSAAEIDAALEAGIKCFNVESIPELHRLNEIAGAINKKAPIAIRVNPDTAPKTHSYMATGIKTSKFGIAFNDARAVYQQAVTMPYLEVIGIDCHIGSQLTEIAPYVEALDKLLDLVEVLETDGIPIHHVDLGGGLGICYQAETLPTINTFISTLLNHVKKRGHAHREVWFEPGRSLIGPAGILLTRIEYLKQSAEKNFAIVDAAINDLIRPSMYGAYHEILPVSHNTKRPGVLSLSYDIVGPICESGDWFGKDRRLTVASGDYLAVCAAGAYGFVMSSNYNTRPRAAEVIVDDDHICLVRQRETVAQLFESEQRLSD